MVGFAALMRVAAAGRQSLGNDELFSLAMATGHSLEHPADRADASLGDYVEPREPVAARDLRRYLEHEPSSGLGGVVRAVRLSDTSPPLYYVLLSLWTRAAGTSDAGLRLFSVLWAVACMPVVWMLASRVGGRAAALASLLLFSLSPIGLFYSVEGRMYSLVWFLSAVLMALTLAVAEGRSRLWVPWVLVGTAGLLTHYFYFFVWLACVGWLAVTPRRARRVSLAAGVAATAVLASPWYAVVPETARQWRVTQHWLDPGFWGLSRLGAGGALTAPLELAWSFLSGRWPPWATPAPAGWVAFATFAALGVALAVAMRRRLFSGDLSLSWACLAAACAGPVVFDLVRGTMTVTQPRYALAGWPAAVVLAGLAVGRVPLAWRLGALALVVGSWTPGLAASWRLPSHYYEPYRDVARIAEEGVGPEGVLIVHSIPSGVLGIARYAGEATPVASWVGQLGLRRVPEDVEALTAGRARAVLVEIHDVGDSAAINTWLRDHAVLASERRLESGEVSVFVPRTGERFRW
jgi:hypothetical protein